MNNNNNQPTILIVDDDASIRLMLRDTLEDIGLNINEADNGESAITLFKETRPAAIILDVNMPGKNGFAVCEEIRRLPGGLDIPIMMATGSDDFDSIEKSFQVGATDFIIKPINWDVLSYRVRYLLRVDSIKSHHINTTQQLVSAKRMAKIADWSWNIHKQQLYWSPELHTLIDDQTSELPNKHDMLLQYVHDKDKQTVAFFLKNLFEENISFELEYRIVNANNVINFVHEKAQVIYDDNGYPLSILGVIQNITERKINENKIKQLAYFDTLTGLPNRSLCLSNLDHAISKAKENNHNVTVLFVDLDGFKQVNDIMGHTSGDKLLQIVADRLTKCLRENDYIIRNSVEYVDEANHPVSRLAGDEFIIMLDNNISTHDTNRVANRLISTINQPLTLNGRDIYIGASMGIAVYPRDGDNVETLLKNADSAMYCSKKSGKNIFKYYDKAINELALQRIKLGQDLKNAIAKDELFLEYQPKIDLRSNKISGFEALVRWNHPTLGIIKPDDFIPLAEESHIIFQLSEQVLKKACHQNKKWLDDGYDVSVAVNISALAFSDKSFIDVLNQCLNETGMDPKFLVLELTESQIMKNTKQSIKILNAAKALGVNIHIDDFGTVYSSLRYISQFPLDSIKIDKSFVGNLPNSPTDIIITKAIIALAHSLNLSVIAEGVETFEQFDLLRKEHCDELQGYYISHPIKADLMATFLVEFEKKQNKIFICWWQINLSLSTGAPG